MCGEGFIEGNKVIKAYVKPFNTPWKEVEAVDSDGLAIFEGCIILGRTDQVEESYRELEQQIAVDRTLGRDTWRGHCRRPVPLEESHDPLPHRVRRA